MDRVAMAVSNIPSGEPGVVVDRINYRPLIEFLANNRRKILVSAMFAALFLVMNLFLGQRLYTSEALVAEKKQDSNSSSVTSPAKQLLAAAGGSDSADSADYARLPVVMTSASLAQRLAANPSFLRILFPERWDNAHGRWKPSNSFFLKTVKTALGYRVEETPGPNAVMAVLQKNLIVTPDSKQNFYKLDYTAKNMDGAQTILTEIIQSADSLLRERAIDESKRHVDYILDELKSTSSIEQRNALTTVLTKAEYNLVMANSDINYSFDYIDFPTKPYKPTLDIRAYIALFVLLTVLIFSVLHFGPKVGFRLFSNGRKA